MALAALAAALLCTLALAGLAARLAWSRRRRALNEALHELRRPLQVLALVGAPAAGGAIELALAAVDDLDREINGSAGRPAARPTSCRALVEQAIERWRAVAAGAGRALALDWQAGDAIVSADPLRVARALDNLIANAIEHGGLSVRVEVSATPQTIRILVLDSGRGAAASPRGRGRDPRHGHGLRVASRIAAEHGGRFLLGRLARGTAAVLELPRASG